jgi:hypothetical protein
MLYKLLEFLFQREKQLPVPGKREAEEDKNKKDTGRSWIKLVAEPGTVESQQRSGVQLAITSCTYPHENSAYSF